MFKINWKKDKQIIESALSDTKVFTKHHIGTHIIIETSLFIDHFNESFNKLIPFWNSRIQKISGEIKRFDGESSLDLASSNQLTLLNGWKSTFSTKDEVRQAYLDSKRKRRYSEDKSSVNDDLENMKGRIFYRHKAGYEHVKTFLYEMMSEREMENQHFKQLCKEFQEFKINQFLRSRCERLTVTLY